MDENQAPVQAALFPTGEDSCTLLLRMMHAQADGMSYVIVVNELAGGVPGTDRDAFYAYRTRRLLNRREFPKELQEYYRDFEGSYRLPATPSKETDHVDIRTVTLTRQETQRLKTKCEQKGISLPGYVVYCFGRGLLIALSKETAWFSHTYSGRDENFIMAEYIRPRKNRRALESDRWWGYADFERIYVVGTGNKSRTPG